LLKLGLECFRRAKIERTQFPLSLKVDAVTLRIQFTGKYASSKIVFSYCLKHVTCQGVAEDREAGMASIGVNRMLFQDNNNDDDEYSSTLKTDAWRSFHWTSHLQIKTVSNNQSPLAYPIQSASS